MTGPVADARPEAAAEALFPQISEDLREVEKRLRQVVHSRVPVVPEVYLHSVQAGGKRVRPALVLLAARACGGADERILDVAVVLELIHLASLIHDDVIDDSARRRARLTANRVWGNKTAVLVADYLHSVAYRLLSQRCSPVALTRLTETVSRMVEGELTQMFNEGSLELTEAQYFELIGDKTGCLMALSCELGARAAGGSPELVAALAEYGLKVGLAFQVVDDLLDLVGDEERLGKPVGNDIRCGRLTLPLLHVMHNGCPDARERLVPLICRPALETSDLRRIRDVVDAGGGLAYAAATARRLSAEAQALLVAVPDEGARAALHALAAYVVARTL